MFLHVSVIHSVHRGEYLTSRHPPEQTPSLQTRYTPLIGGWRGSISPADTPLEQTPPWTRYTPLGPGTPPGADTPQTSTLPQTRYTPLGPGIPPRPGTPPWDQVHPPSRDQVHPPAGTRYTPLGPGTPPGTKYTPPGKQTPAYGQRAGGTHPTGMHSYY